MPFCPSALLPFDPYVALTQHRRAARRLCQGAVPASCLLNGAGLAPSHVRADGWGARLAATQI
jgi:hypothetical protein